MGEDERIETLEGEVMSAVDLVMLVIISWLITIMVVVFRFQEGYITGNTRDIRITKAAFEFVGGPFTLLIWVVLLFKEAIFMFANLCGIVFRGISQMYRERFPKKVVLPRAKVVK